MKREMFARFALGVLGYTILVILFGAYVRATGSGAGCGSHWPLCNGDVIPQAPQAATIIEFTHRISSGFSLILVIAMFAWAFRGFERGHPVRMGASLSLLFIVTEALVGAGLVLFKWVAQDASLGRAISIVVHLLNTFLLLAALTLTAWWAYGGRGLALHGTGSIVWLLVAGYGGTLFIGASGALAALGDTLFPVSSLAEGIRMDFSPTAHFLIRLRLLHPAISVIVGAYLLLIAGVIRIQQKVDGVRRVSQALTIFVLVQLAVGALNVLLLAPVVIQLVHLFLADMVWIVLVLLGAMLFQKEEAEILESRRPPDRVYATG